LIEQGYGNAKVVLGGGDVMEKFFDYYRNGKIISPMMGTTIDTKTSPLRNKNKKWQLK